MEENKTGKHDLCDHPLQPNGLMKDNTIGDALRRESLNMEQELRVASIVKDRLPGKDKDSRPKQDPQRPLLFSAKELSSCIIASETTRIICSVSIALLVVLSFIDYPVLGVNIVNSKSIIALRPLYLLLVTEITVIIAYLVFRRRRYEASEEDTGVSKGGGVNWERAETLERGLVAHQTIRAVFIDFSVYVVIVICILSLATLI
ncbi:uncharacterized protein LOC110703344 isoform X1 [Chenopodium quinoa]|uniref:uncharacterized protein LOC110703344 isoform X1 n=2 Tax=Chenopodium quinoa TaxID=63459 RepID=UPI000B78237C|nr:uncharacterized protein LOC110703344 isoform X1 [Chenopodium quinoa]